MWENDLTQEIITERIQQIIVRYGRANEPYFKKQEAILSTLDTETRRKFETFVESLEEWNAGEQRLIYREAFYDGLRLAHKAF